MYVSKISIALNTGLALRARQSMRLSQFYWRKRSVHGNLGNNQGNAGVDNQLQDLVCWSVHAKHALALVQIICVSIYVLWAGTVIYLAKIIGKSKHAASIMCALNLCPRVWMCGYIVKVCGSESRGVRARQCEHVIICSVSLSRTLTPFRAWHVTSEISIESTKHTGLVLRARQLLMFWCFFPLSNAILLT
jgi:hypothetical protein